MTDDERIASDLNQALCDKLFGPRPTPRKPRRLTRIEMAARGSIMAKEYEDKGAPKKSEDGDAI